MKPHWFRDSRWRSSEGSTFKSDQQSRAVLKGTQRSLSRLIRHFAIKGLWGFLLLLIVEFLVIPQIAGAGKTLHLLSRANYWLIPLAILAEAASLYSYAKLTASVLPRPQPSLGTIAKVDLSSLAVSHVLPGGTASGAGMTVRLFNSLGVRPTDSAFALATQGIGSAVVLNLLLWVALIVSIPIYGFQTLYLLVAVAGILLIGSFAGLVVAFTRGTTRVIDAAEWMISHIPVLKRYRTTVHNVVIRIGQQVTTLTSNKALLKRAIFWASLNWLLDATALWIMLAAFGRITDPDALIVSYGIANIAAAIPITPGGLGVVEGILIPLLTGFGTPRGIAILGVLGYRLFNFWIPIPVGVGTYVSLRLGRGEDATLELDRVDPPRDESSS
ncbi:MAG: lysylphosphatidylglycerol synthase transmembrane domain-containing protein [Ferrimicrobium sp.]